MQDPPARFRLMLAARPARETPSSSRIASTQIAHLATEGKAEAIDADGLRRETALEAIAVLAASSLPEAIALRDVLGRRRFVCCLELLEQDLLAVPQHRHLPAIDIKSESHADSEVDGRPRAPR